MRIVFAGTPEFAVPALNALANSRHSLIGVLTQPDRPAGRGRSLTASAVKQRALQLGLPLAQPERLSTEAQRTELLSWRPELLVVVAYGLLLPRAVLDLPRLGCLNIHASLLPRWRGAAPIQRAILAGDAETGVAIMGLEAALDTGPVFVERRVAIAMGETAGELQARLAALGAEALIAVVDQLEAGTAAARAQSATGATYAHKINKAEALIDWTKSAVELVRQVSAFNPWPVAETWLNHERVRIWRAHAVPANTVRASADRTTTRAMKPVPGCVAGMSQGALLVNCGDGLLAIESLQMPGKRAIRADDFARSHALGHLHFGAPP